MTSVIKNLFPPNREAIIAPVGTGFTAHLKARLVDWSSSGKHVVVIDDGRLNPAYGPHGVGLSYMTISKENSRMETDENGPSINAVTAYDLLGLFEEPSRRNSVLNEIVSAYCGSNMCDAFVVIDAWQYNWDELDVSVLQNFRGDIVLSFLRPRQFKRNKKIADLVNRYCFHKISGTALSTINDALPELPKSAIKLISECRFRPGPVSRIDTVLWNKENKLSTNEVIFEGQISKRVS